MKLAPWHLRESTRSDLVHARAAELRITPYEVFCRAYTDFAGKKRSTAIVAFERYCQSSPKNPKIPDVVRRFCKLPLPTCSNPACPNPRTVARFTKTAIDGETSYFCSPKCMGVEPEKVGKRLRFDHIPVVAPKTTEKETVRPANPPEPEPAPEEPEERPHLGQAPSVTPETVTVVQSADPPEPECAQEAPPPEEPPASSAPEEPEPVAAPAEVQTERPRRPPNKKYLWGFPGERDWDWRQWPRCDESESAT